MKAEDVPIEENRDSRPRKRMHGCVVAVVVLVVLVLLVVTVGPAVLRWFVLRKLEPESRQRLEIFSTRPVHLPPNWQKPEPYSADALQGAKELKAILGTQGSVLSDLYSDYHLTTATSALRKGNTVPEEFWTSFSLVRDACEPLIEPADVLTSDPTYSFEILGTDYQSLFPVQMLRKGVAAATFSYMRDGDTTRAIETALCPYRIMKTVGGPRQPMLQMWSGGNTELAAATLRTSDSTLLESSLEVVLGIRGLYDPLPVELRLSEPYLASLYGFAKDGFPLMLETGKTGRYYQRLQYELPVQYYEWKLAQLPLNHPDRSDTQRSAEGWREFWGPVPGWARDYVFAEFTSDIFFAMSDPNMLETEKRFERAGTHYNLLRLHLAQRVLESRGDAVTTPAMLSLLPDLKAVPGDAFSPRDEALRYDDVRRRFFSVGEDGVDHHQTVGSGGAGSGAAGGGAQKRTFGGDWVGDDIVAVPRGM